MSTITRPLSAEELLRLPDDGFRYELINGELIKMSPPGSEHGAVVVRIAILLGQYVQSRKLGEVLAGDSGFRLASNPDTVLAPDVSFIRRERIPTSGLPRGYFPGAPDLAIEVLSPGDSSREVADKAKRWLAAGALMVWTVDPRKKSATVYRPQDKPAKLAAGDTLEGETVIAGFRCRVAELFS